MGFNLHTLNSLTEADRLNLCDIAWFIRGMQYGKEKHEQIFGEEHSQTLEHVIQGISNKLSDEKLKANDQVRNS